MTFLEKLGFLIRPKLDTRVDVKIRHNSLPVQCRIYRHWQSVFRSKHSQVFYLHSVDFLFRLMKYFGFDRLDSLKILCRLNETELAMDQLNLPEPKNGPRFPQKDLDSRMLSKWTESWQIDEKPGQPQIFFLSNPILVLVKVSASRKPKKQCW